MTSQARNFRGLQSDAQEKRSGHITDRVVFEEETAIAKCGVSPIEHTMINIDIAFEGERIQDKSRIGCT